MKQIALLGVIALFAVSCSKTEQTKSDGPTGGVMEPATKPPASQAPYEPKPGETIIMFTFKTEGDTAVGNGNVYIKMNPAAAPKTCAHILDLVKKGYYTNILVHRVEREPGFKLVQWGNAATRDGTPNPGVEVGSGKNVPLEKKASHTVGAVGLARSNDPNSGDAQMYICLVPIPSLDSGYAVFGDVVQGLDVVEGLDIGSKVTAAKVIQEAK